MITGLNKEITLSFLPAGHTKFSPDWCFGLFKQRFRRSEVNSLNDIVKVVEESSCVNKSQLVGTSDGDTIVHSFDWTGYLAPFFKRIKSIKAYHHFVVNSETPGQILMRKTCDGPVTKEQLLRNLVIVPSSDLPPIPPSGLSNERQWYLYEKIREYCSDECKDLTCPLPTCPRPAASTRNTPDIDENVPEASEEVEAPVNPPKRRVCKNCGTPGHNSRTCTS